MNKDTVRKMSTPKTIKIHKSEGNDIILETIDNLPSDFILSSESLCIYFHIL